MFAQGRQRRLGYTGGRFGRTASSALVCAALLAVGATSTGCANAGQGAASGAALGALAGMGLGSLSGDMGKGAAAGAIIGGLGGLIIGDQNQRADKRAGTTNSW